jgi:electron transport complex protein RnfB
MTDDVYRRLQRHLDGLPVAFPETASGVELRILRRLFTEVEAEVALAMGALPETAEKIAARLPGCAPEDVAGHLARMLEKGALFGRKPRLAAPRYALAPLAVGMYEAQVDKLTPELQRDFEAYTREGFAEALLLPKTKQMRTIPLDVKFVPDRRVGRYDDARGMIADGPGPWAARNCVCRQGKELVGEPCRQTKMRRVCLMIGGSARAAAASGEAQPLTREETLALLAEAEREGMVLQPSNSQDPDFICLCCGCCCGVLQAAKQFPKPAEYLHANYQAEVAAGLCTECGTCQPRCPMEALRAFDCATVVDLDRCIGCGVCAPACPEGAIRLRPKAEEVVPPRDGADLYRRMVAERFGPPGAGPRTRG